MRTLIGIILFATACVAQYAANWTSLDARPLPDWYDQSKFGIFIHWGVFSVPSWGPSSGGASGEWFWWEWQGTDPNPAFAEFVNETYGLNWEYTDFAPRFTAELWDPEEWANLFANSGARYVVLTSKHHEGWTNYPSEASWNWNSVTNGPHRDLVGDLTKAIRETQPEIHVGLYHSLFEWFNPIFLADQAANFTTNAYVEDVLMPELYTLINNYQPEILWSDGDWMAPDTYWQSQEFLAWLYNESPVKDVVVTNDRWGINCTCRNGGYWTCEDRFNPLSKQNHKWENAMTIDAYSWGFRRNANFTDYLTFNDILYQLVTTVACGGNLLLNVGPSWDGTIMALFQDRLLAIGAWLGVNGDAIYATQPWRVVNDTTSVWYTTQGSIVYAIALEWPASGVVALGEPVTCPATTVTMLGYSGGALPWSPSSSGPGMTFKLPMLTPEENPSTYGWVFALSNVQ